MKNIYNKIRLQIIESKEKIYIFSLAIFLISTILSSNTQLGEEKISIIMTLGRYFSLILVLLKIVICDIKEYDLKTYIKIIILFVISVIIGVFSDSRIFLQYLILILGAYNIKFDRILKSVLCIEGLTVIFIILLSLFNIIPNRVYDRNGSEVLRYSLGFKYSTYSAIYMWYFTTLYLYARKGKTKILEYTFLIIVNWVLYYFTNSRTELICAIFIIVIDIIYNKYNKKALKKVFDFFAKYSMIILTIFSLIIAFCYNSQNEMLYKLNKIFSGRFYLANKGVENFGITLFGNKIEWIGQSLVYSGMNTMKEFNYVDISYLNILYNFGIVALFLILYAFLKTTKKQIDEGNKYIACSIFIITIHSFINPQLFQIVYNIFILLFVDLIITPLPKKMDKRKENVMTSNNMSLEEIHNEEINMMKKFIEYCEKNNLTYYICGGTLLGAIRHKGFIPWDDDIDILMPRPDFTKFEELALRDNLLIAENMEVHSFNLGNLNDPFCKIMNLNTIMDKHFINDEYDKHLWLDVFPMDGLPENQKQIEKIYKKVLFLRRIVVMLKAKDEIIKKESKSKFKSLLKPILRILLKPIGVKRFIKKINKTCTKYDYNTSKYVGGIAWGYGPQEKLLREKVQDEKVIFENMEVNTFKCYDEYLKNLYGNYMELPPKDKQVAHIMNVKKIKIGE